MKRISSTILVFFLSLLVFVLGFITLWNFSLLRSEAKSHTLQLELIQTESVGKPLMSQITGVRALISNGHFSGSNLNELKTLGVMHVLKLSHAQSQWEIAESVSSAEDKTLNQLVSRLKKPGVKILPYSNENHFVALSSLGTQEGALVILDLTPVFKDCEGQGIGIINDSGELLLSCDPHLNSHVFSPDLPELKRIIDSKFSAGSFESLGKDPLLYSYFQPNSLLSVIGVTPSKVAFRSAYFLALRMVLLLICGFGLVTLLSVFVARKVTGPIELVIEATSRISQGDFDFPIEVQSKNELKTLATAVNQMSQRIKQLIRSEIEKTKIQAQLEVAGTLQRTLLPPKSVSPQGFQIESLYLPADQCGGDWWSYIERGNKLILLIGDVTGHGYPSALLVAAVRGGIALIEADLETRKSDDCQPGQILTTLNRVVYDSAQAQLAMTAQCAIIDRDTGEYTLASAGHPNAFSIPREGASLQSIPLMGVRLGEKRNLTEGFQEATGTLGVNEKLVFYTDGLQELGPDEKLLDKKGVVRFFKAMPKSSPLEMIQEVETKLIPLNEGRPLRDDITLVIVERLAHA